MFDNKDIRKIYNAARAAGKDIELVVEREPATSHEAITVIKMRPDLMHLPAVRACIISNTHGANIKSAELRVGDGEAWV